MKTVSDETCATTTVFIFCYIKSFDDKIVGHKNI